MTYEKTLKEKIQVSLRKKQKELEHLKVQPMFPNERIKNRKNIKKAIFVLEYGLLSCEYLNKIKKIKQKQKSLKTNDSFIINHYKKQLSFYQHKYNECLSIINDLK